ncbi:MAG: winged helix-turn-helix domain-containing protein [Candidatus Bathyarchaeia archaeon]
MTRSKLEKHLDILEVLVAKPLEFEIILYQVDQNWEVIKKHLDFLITNGLVEKLPLGDKRVVYSVTEKGLEVLETLRGTEYTRQLDQLLLVYEE